MAGAIGIARTLVYKGEVSEPLYSRRPDGTISDGENDTEPSFFQEYKCKLGGLYDSFCTQKGTEPAAKRRPAAVAFYNNLLKEVRSSCEKGKEELIKLLEE